MIAMRAADRLRRDNPPSAPSENPVGLLLEGARYTWDERRRRREVDRLMSARAPGMSQEDVRALIIEQYERHGLRVPPQPLLDYKADLYRELDPEARCRIRADMGAVLREEVAPLIRMAKHMFAPHRDP
jgi:hypothetical protein